MKIKKPKISEYEIQCNICWYLNLHKIEYYAVPNGIFFNSKNPWGYMKKLFASGFKKGVSDLVILLEQGKSLYVEIKTPQGKQSPDQIDFQARIENLGHTYLLWRSLDDCMKYFEWLNKPKIYTNDNIYWYASQEEADAHILGRRNNDKYFEEGKSE